MIRDWRWAAAAVLWVTASALAATESATSYLTEGVRQLRAGQYEMARRYLFEAVRRDPRSAAARARLADAYAALEKYADAATQLRFAQQLSPAAYSAAAPPETDFGAPARTARVIATLQRAVIVDPKNREADFLLAYYRSRSGDGAAARTGPTKGESVVEFLTRHYATAPGLQGPEAMLAAAMGVGGKPRRVRVLSMKVEPGGRVRLELEPAEIPPGHAETAKKPGFSMRGSVVVVSQGGSWRVHKDRWTTVWKEGGAERKSSYGEDPDGEDQKKSDESWGAWKRSVQKKFELPDSMREARKLADLLKKSLKRTGEGNVDVVFRIAADGTLTDVLMKDEKGRSGAEADVKQAAAALRWPGPVPASLIAEPHGWMNIYWTDSSIGHSGPYFSAKKPDHMIEKIKGK